MSPKTSRRTPVLLVGCEDGGVDNPSRSADDELFAAAGAASWWFVVGAGLFPSLISLSGIRPGFFFLRTARIEDSLSGNAGISSKTVACTNQFFFFLFFSWNLFSIEKRVWIKSRLDKKNIFSNVPRHPATQSCWVANTLTLVAAIPRPRCVGCCPVGRFLGSDFEFLGTSWRTWYKSRAAVLWSLENIDDTKIEKRMLRSNNLENQWRNFLNFNNCHLLWNVTDGTEPKEMNAGHQQSSCQIHRGCILQLWPCFHDMLELVVPIKYN